MVSIRSCNYLPFRNANLTPPSSCPTGELPVASWRHQCWSNHYPCDSFCGKGNHSQMLPSLFRNLTPHMPRDWHKHKYYMVGISVYFEDYNLRISEVCLGQALNHCRQSSCTLGAKFFTNLKKRPGRWCSKADRMSNHSWQAWSILTPSFLGSWFSTGVS